MADQIYVGQEALELRLNTNVDLSAASSVSIKYIKPDETTGEFTGEVFNTTWIKYEFLIDAGELDQQGNWIFWTFAIMGDGRDIPGDPVEYYVKLQGDV